MADGGEGTVDALVAATDGQLRTSRVIGPLGEPVDARWALLDNGRTAVIEMAEAAGLARVPEDRRDPTRTTTYGVGQLIAAALEAGASSIIIGIGGSSTNDGGAGMAQALGVRLVLEHADDAPRYLGGGWLDRITGIDLAQRDPRLDRVSLRVACDVTNPLTGDHGAAAVYAPQKGATAEQVGQLDAALGHLARSAAAAGIDVDPAAPGMGAAGGLGFGLVAFCGGRLEPGIDLVCDAVGFDERAAQADLVITGEGKLDRQSIRGKTCIGVARRAARFERRVIALVAVAGEGADQTLHHGLASYHAIVGGRLTAAEATARPGEHLADLAERVMRQIG